MEIPHQIFAYLAVAAATILISLGLLLITKVPAVVMLCSAILAAALYSVYARLDIGYWDKFAAIAFFFTAIYAFAVSFALLGIGRLLRWPFFLRGTQ
jgi:hypothetical protein